MQQKNTTVTESNAIIINRPLPKDSILIRENTGQRKPVFWYIFRSATISRITQQLEGSLGDQLSRQTKMIKIIVKSSEKCRPQVFYRIAVSA